MTKLPWLHVSDLPAGNAHFGFLCVAASVTGLLKTSFGGRFLCPIIAGAVVFFGAGLRLQGAPVMNADIARLLEAGMSEQVILQAIAVGQPDFDLSPDALIVLKNKGQPRPSSLPCWRLHNRLRGLHRRLRRLLCRLHLCQQM